MHSAKIDNSARLQTVRSILRAHPNGITSFALRNLSNSCAPATDVSELRKNGCRIDCDYGGLSENGRKIWRYTLVAEPAAETQLAPGCLV